jgi:DHA1 family bicyclomycin/chloramphenicol resistance-like MFS transporter
MGAAQPDPFAADRGCAFAIALSMPLLVGHALHPFPGNAGLAASCQLFLQYSLMAVVAGLLAPLLWNSLSQLAWGCAALTCISMTLLLWQRHATHKANQVPA